MELVEVLLERIEANDHCVGRKLFLLLQFIIIWWLVV